jgi:quercetin dioxygenase-like cupin family protein
VEGSLKAFYYKKIKGNQMNNKYPPYVKYDPDKVENVETGISRQVLAHDSNLMIVKVWFDEGAIGYEHKHHHTQASYVESGKFEVKIDGVTSILESGDSFYVEPFKMHGAVCLEKGCSDRCIHTP